MKQKKFFSSVTILFCLLTACAENGASSDDRKENELSGVLADAFTKGDDIRGILSKGFHPKQSPPKGFGQKKFKQKHFLTGLIQPSVFRLSVSIFLLKNNTQKQRMILLFVSRDSIIRL